MGPLFIDLLATELSSEEREMLQHPLVAGVILFSRNYHDRAQLIALVKSIRAASRTRLIIAVDHEGGRVQRFREQFSAIPAMGHLAAVAEHLNMPTEQLAKQMGWLMAAELRACDIDLSFAPVLDVNGISDVIGLRAFSEQPQHIIPLASAFIDGMALAGMKATGKHFPGHGNVKADTHHFEARDVRSFNEIQHHDMQVFKALISQNKLDAVMPAHVIYPEVDEQPAGFSAKWLQQILRQQLAFKGLIFSDDLSMKGAAVVGDYVARAKQALAAGCDLLLACNDRDASIRLLDGLVHTHTEAAASLLGKAYPASWSELAAQNSYKQITAQSRKVATITSEWDKL